MKNILKLISLGVILSIVGCEKGTSTTTTETYPATVTKPATVTDKHTVEVHENSTAPN